MGSILRVAGEGDAGPKGYVVEFYFSICNPHWEDSLVNH